MSRNPSNVLNVTSVLLTKEVSYIIIDHFIVICLINVANVAKAPKIGEGPVEETQM